MGAIDIPPEPAWVKDIRPLWLSWEHLVRVFFNKTTPCGDIECSEWKGIYEKGYPVLRVCQSRRDKFSISARKLSAAINGLDFTPKRLIPRCGNARCVSGNHLVVSAIAADSYQDERVAINTYLDRHTESQSDNGCKIWRGKIRHGVPWAKFSFNGQTLFDNPARHVVLSASGRRVGKHSKLRKTTCGNILCVEVSHIVIPPQLVESDEELAVAASYYAQCSIRTIKRARIVREKGIDRDDILMSSGRIKKVGGQYKKCKWCGERFYVFNSDAAHTRSCRRCLDNGRKGTHKLSDDDIRNVILLKKSGITYRELCDMYGVCSGMLVNIVKGRSYKFVTL